LGYVPDVIYDKGGVGKDAMVRIIGKDAGGVVDAACKIGRLLK